MIVRRPAAPRPRLEPEEFRLLRDLVYEYAGIHFDQSAMFLFDRRLGERVEELGLYSFGAYYKYLRFNSRGQSELEDAVERLTTKETYFFRQEYQLRALKEEILPKLHESNARHKRLTIWSAGCSTGEEAYTLAILVHETRLFRDWEVRVIGSDLSRVSIAFARRGVYQTGSFRTTSPEQRNGYFYEGSDGAHVLEEVKRLCHFGQLNLLDMGQSSIVGRVDVVLCRNVLIYFDVQSRRRVIDNLYQRLVPGGYLLLGHSESLLNLSTAFELVHLREDLVYRKPRAAERWDGGAQR